MALTKPTFTSNEASALRDAARYATETLKRAREALGENPERVQACLRALDKLEQNLR